MDVPRDLKGKILIRYGSAMALGGLILLLMRPFETAPEVTALQIPLVAVILSSLFLGFFPGLLTALICSVGVAYLYLEPRNTFVIHNNGDTFTGGSSMV